MHLLIRGAIASVALTVAIAANGMTAAAASAAGPAEDSSTRALVARALDDMGQGDAATALTAPDDATPGATLQTPAGGIAVSPVATDDSLVRVAPGEVQALTVLRDGADVTSFDLDLPDGFHAVPHRAGFDIVAVLDGAGRLTAGHIDAPWAIGADGSRVTTHFDLAGDTLTQTIDAQGAAFPVVVDPLVTVGLANAPYGPGLYLNLLGSQMREIAAASAVLLGIGSYAVCTTSRIPAPVARIVQLGCNLMGGSNLLGVVALVQRVYASHRFGYYACYQTRIGSGRDFVWTEHANCA